MSKYKYVSDGGFPYLENENVYSYENTFNYNLWGENTVLRVLHVPWDRDYSNVVIFDSKEARDTWVSEHTLQEYRLQTAINIQSDGTIKLPIPFDVLAKCNYIVVDYAFAPVDYEITDRISSMGYFIDNVMQQAPSTTQARVSLDYWYTFIYDIDITYLDLERGHAPLAAITADKYLENPIENNTYLLTPDVNFSNDDRTSIKQVSEWIANDGENYAVFACTGNVSSEYWGTTGTRDMQVPGVAAPKFFNTRSGYDYIAIKAEQLDSFIAQCNGARPHFLQTIAGMFIVPGKLITITGSTTWSGISGITLYYIDTEQKYYELLSFTRDNFNYDTRYTNIAKLYTYPYCHIEITDENGNTSIVKVENTTGTLGINAALNLIYPFIGMDIIPLGISGAEVISSTYGWTGTKQFNHSGDWYSLIKHYDIPAFIVSQSQNDRARYNRYFQNAQSNTALENTYTSTLASNQTGYDNAIASNQTGYNNTLATNQTGYNNSIANINNSYNNIHDSLATAYAIAQKGNQVAYADAINQIIVSDQAFTSHIANDLIAAMNGGINTLTGTVGAAASGNATGALGGAVNLVTGMASFPLVLSNNQDIYDKSRQAAVAHMDFYWGVGGDTATVDGYGPYSATQNKTTQDANNQRTQDTSTANALASKTTADGNALASKTTADANAGRTKSTGDANAGRTRATSLAAIDNGNRAQGVEAPAVYGTNSGTGNAASRPLGLFVNVATQSKAAIKAAGDQFLRYGYMLEQAWIPEKLQVMKLFTYWKAADIWISGRGLTIEDASETIKRIFLNGTTIWDKPEDVGNVSIYDNI